MKRTTPMLFLGALLLLGSACPSPDSASTPDPTPVATPAEAESAVQKAIKLARAIQADPDHAEDVLASAGLSIEDFDSLLVSVASDPKAAAAYAQAVN